MTLFAGVVSRTPAPVPTSVRRALAAWRVGPTGKSRSYASAQAAAHPAILEDEGYCFATFDTGAFGGPGYVADRHGISLLAGEPLLGEHDIPRPREDDLRALHEAVEQDVSSVLREANGVFAFAHLHADGRRLTLAADKLALRPIYYAIAPEWVIFTTVYRLFDDLPEFDRTVDLRAMTEVSTFYHPLGDRMPYARVSRIRAAEIVTVSAGPVKRSTYWRWDAIAVSPEPIEVLAERAYHAFARAVARRRDDARGPIAYLSGGLDSRAVVAALVSQGRVPQTWNFAWPGTLDHALGAAIAARLGTRHRERQKPDGARTPDYAQLMADALADTTAPGAEANGSIVWSGEGGSVALGHVHMHAAVVERMRAGDVDGALVEFCAREDLRVLLKLFAPAAARRVAGVVREGVGDELTRLARAEAGRRFHLFLLLNDQRRKLTSHFETIDRHGVELQLPFFDSAFLTVVLAVPVDACLGHRFYNRWMAHFDARVHEVPWQPYPGHDSCPLPLPEGLSYQWNADYQRHERQVDRRRLLRRIWQMLRSPDFPHVMFSRPRLCAAAALHATGLRDYEYALDTAVVCHGYTKTCGGRWTLQEIDQDRGEEQDGPTLPTRARGATAPAG